MSPRKTRKDREGLEIRNQTSDIISPLRPPRPLREPRSLNKLAQRPKGTSVFCHSVRPDFVPLGCQMAGYLQRSRVYGSGFQLGGNMRPACAIDTTPVVAFGCGRLECQFEAALVFGDVPNTAREDACASRWSEYELQEIKGINRAL
jgi:hypothetical protein